MSIYAGTTDVPHFVYRCFAADGSLLYIGCTVDVTRRMRQHGPNPWAAGVARIATEGPYPYELARRVEADAIRDEDPLHNANAPTNGQDHRRRVWHFNAVYHAALEHGEPRSEAARLALLAVNSETAASP